MSSLGSRYLALTFLALPGGSGCGFSWPSPPFCILRPGFPPPPPMRSLEFDLELLTVVVCCAPASVEPANTRSAPQSSAPQVRIDMTFPFGTAQVPVDDCRKRRAANQGGLSMQINT